MFRELKINLPEDLISSSQSPRRNECPSPINSPLLSVSDGSAGPRVRGMCREHSKVGAEAAANSWDAQGSSQPCPSVDLAPPQELQGLLQGEDGRGGRSLFSSLQGH